MVTNYKPTNANHTRAIISESLPRGRRRMLGTVRRTRKGTIFTAARPLSMEHLDSVTAILRFRK